MMAALRTFLLFIVAFGAQRALGDLASIKAQLISSKLGGEANLTCDGITDYRNSTMLFEGKQRIVEKPGKFHQLPNGSFLIKNIQPSDIGKYRYDSKGLAKRDYCIIELQINEETMRVNPGSTASMSCKVPDAPMLEKWSEVTWRRKYSSKTSIIVKNGSVSQLAKESFSGRLSASGKKLVIKNAEQSDSGKYICFVVFKDYSPRGSYYINLIVSMPSTAKPTDMKVKTSNKSSIATSASSTTKSGGKQKSGAMRPDFYLPLAILILLPLLA